MAMFQDPIAPKPNPAGKKVRQPLAGQPTYDNKKLMYPCGNYYGTGFKAKVGRLRDSSVAPSNIPQKAFKKAPESLA